MEDMDFHTGLAFSLNEKEETVNSNNSDFLILFLDTRSLGDRGAN